MVPDTDTLIAEHMPLAHSLALQVWRKAPHALEFEELVAIANLSLVQTAQRWEPFCAEYNRSPLALEFFKPFVVRRVKGALIDAIRQADWATRNLRERAKQLVDAGQDRGLSDVELARRSGMSVKDVRETLGEMAKRRPVSLEGEELEPSVRQSTEAGHFAEKLLGRFAAGMRTLPLEQQVVIALRYHQGLQLQEVAAALGLAETRVSDLHTEAILALHRVMVDAADYREGDPTLLSADEKKVGRAFRAQAQEELTQSFVDDPPTYTVLPVLGVLRHSCPKRGGVSTGLELREVYRLSPDDPATGVRQGRFAFVYRDGRCRFCGQTARSTAGRLIDGKGRGPIHGRTVYQR